MDKNKEKEYHKEYNKKHYKKNKQKYIDQARKRMEYRRELINTYKSNLVCEICGEGDIACLVFHHKNPDNKYNGISEMIKNCNAVDKIMEEIGKCMLICANCHMKLHRYGDDFYKLE